MQCHWIICHRFNRIANSDTTVLRDNENSSVSSPHNIIFVWWQVCSYITSSERLVNIMKITTIMMMEIIQPSVVICCLLGNLCHQISEVKPTILAAVLREVSPSLQENVDKMLIIRPNTKHRSSTIVFYYTPHHVSAVQFSHHQVDIRYTQKMFICCIKLGYCCAGGKIETNEMGRACGAYGGG